MRVKIRAEILRVILLLSRYMMAVYERRASAMRVMRDDERLLLRCADDLMMPVYDDAAYERSARHMRVVCYARYYAILD